MTLSLLEQSKSDQTKHELHHSLPSLSHTSKQTSPPAPSSTLSPNETDAEILKSLDAIDQRLQFFFNAPGTNLLDADQLLAFFEQREKQDNPDLIAQRYDREREEVDKRQAIFERKMARKEKQWEVKKKKYLQRAHMKVLKQVCSISFY